jgi:hypothetical protein
MEHMLRSVRRSKERHAHLLALEWDAEEDDALQALLHERAEELLEAVHAPAALAGQACDFDACVGFVGDEDRVHEHGLRELPPALPPARERVLVAALEYRGDVHVLAQS